MEQWRPRSIKSPLTYIRKYLDYGSHHPLQYKAGVIPTLFTRAQCLSSTATEHCTEVNHVVSVLRRNGYSRKMVDRFSVVRQSSTTNDDGEQRIRGTFQYAKGISEALRWVLACANITMVFHPHSTLRQQLMCPKIQLTISTNRMWYILYCVRIASYICWTDL